MYTGLLSDLDELVQLARDPLAKGYIAEAVSAYRVGAFRSAIIATWVAVAYDLIAKIRELGSGGQAQAQEFVRDLDTAIGRANVRKLQEIERDILTTAREHFELLAPHEAEELGRLQLDRRLCAHPAFVAADRLFEPAPDAVRAHIVHALLYVLHQKPVQGKQALSRVREDLRRLSFPSDPEEAFAYMDAQYLSRAKDSFVKGLVNVLLKALLRGDDADLVGREAAMVNAFRAVARKNPEIFREVVRTKLDDLVAGLTDEQLPKLCRLIGGDGRIWEWLSEPMRLRVRQFVATLDFGGAFERDIIHAASVPELAMRFLERFRLIADDKQRDIIHANPHAVFVKEGIRLYSNAGTYRGAEYLGETVVVPLLASYGAEDVVALLDAAENNNQIWYAGGTASVLEQAFVKTLRYINTTGPAWVAFVDAMCAANSDGHYTYPDLQRMLVESGAMQPRD